MRKIILFINLLLVTNLLFAQKKPLDHSVYDNWQSITSEKVSNSGEWVAYSVNPQAGDANLFIKNLKDKAPTFTYPRSTNFNFSEDNQFIAFIIKPFYQENRQAKIKKKKADDMPKDSLGILKLGSSDFIKVPRIKSFAFPKKVSNVLAYLSEKEVADTTKKKKPAKEDNALFFADETSSSSSKEGTLLTLKDLKSGKEKTFKGVTDYQLSDNGNYLLYVSTGLKKDSILKAGVYLYDISNDQDKHISSGKGIYKNLAFDESTTQLAFTADKGPEKALVKFPQLYYYNFKTDSAIVLVSEKTTGLPQNFSVSENGKVFFSKNAQRLFFGTAPIPTAKDTTLVDFESAKVDVWNYKDDRLQPMQLANLSKDLKISYQAMFDLSQTKFLQLGNLELENISLTKDGNEDFALGETDFGNRIAMQWEGSTLESAYLINLKTGEKTLINKDAKTNYYLSPSARYVIWFDRKTQEWNSYNTALKSKLVLKNPGVIKFGEEDNDVPDDAQSYGFAGFTEDGRHLLIYDRYDIWDYSTSTGEGKNLTNGFGRKNEITFKYVNLDPEQKNILATDVLLLSAFNNKTKQHGWFTKNLSLGKNPTQIVMENYSYSRPLKAKDAKTIIYEKDNYIESPNVYASKDFINETKLSDINPQQKEYNWGTDELVHWTTPKGYPGTGILYKPEDFDPTKKYPMIVYFYEKLSDGLFNYQAPSPTPSRLNIPFFVSNGYLVFTPDISYEIGHPGKSAEEFINSGVEELKKNKWVDGSKIGLQGQSWGGYQVAHLITVTNMYAAAWTGAPVVNMFSAYGAIRWGSGLNRQFQYEKTQSRIGATIWERPDLYIENSPLFKMPNVQTPVVIMSNDGDGSVPWYQGIEMFTALRRLGKPTWLLNYNGDDHNLIQRQNKKDIQIREQQFFDHYLKGAPAPVWLEKGVPAIDKGKNWGLELTTDHK
ncbi:MAG: prolyl oligopeptidase family serine peptidase [Bacteroidetes bacterium]|nr:prolyl oligopeptidase family serine peptidase [Bacteroidota bacterium]MBU1372568.1 prolyl oligopeptidase family serine peptidase [Bacteroidota bacterium]MBU1485023.1 prolyl oligopeptidase family serine peptidase [Bacteroidota bacterium]MBU1761769.1 prolyl oligopeptidase family serine peptidase [Bacteroidota bacterium]MBU2269310.1 prolyl oligopeptidase family serine peptidase [Bacteroidota bacterium]